MGYIMKMSYAEFKRLFADGRLMELQRFRMLFPDTYNKYLTEYKREQGKGSTARKCRKKC